MKGIAVKVYAALHPAGEDCIEAVRRAGRDAVGDPWLFSEGDMLRISFEGLYFPEEAVLEALDRFLPAEAEGRLDILDIEVWELRRHTRQDGRFVRLVRDLNQVLEYAGNKSVQARPTKL